MGNDLYKLLSFYLKNIDININNDELKLQLISHPSYPSLHAITGVLDHFGIENLAAEVPKDKETLNELPEVFFTLIESQTKKDFVVVIKNENGSVNIHYDNKEKIVKSNAEFLVDWSGIVIVAEKNEFTTQDNSGSDKHLVNAVYFISAIILLISFFFAKPSLFQSVHFILSIVGVIISILILQHELGHQLKSVEKLCSVTKATSCEAVFNSKGATILKYFKLSDVCLVYFVSLVVSWLLIVNFETGFLSVILLSLLTIPVTLYSIYYQYFLIKKWCPLCLGIVAVLWLQCLDIFLFYTNLDFTNLNLSNIYIITVSFSVCIALWIFIKPLVKKKEELGKLKIEHYHFKRNFNLFNAVYQKQEHIDTKINDINEIILGDKNAPVDIVIVTSPSCYYCKAAHNAIENLLRQYPKEIKITIRFNINLEDKEGVSYRVVNRLHELYNANKAECLKAMHEAYSDKADLEKWLVKWNEPNNNDYNNTLSKQKEWCHKNGINFTPAMFVNNRAYPKEYDKSDLLYFIDDLIS